MRGLGTRALHLRLDSCGVDCLVDDDELFELAKCRIKEGKLFFSHTHVVEDEIANTPDSKKERRECLLFRLREVSELQPTVGAVVDVSRVGVSRLGSTGLLTRAIRSGDINDIRDALTSGVFPEDAVHGWVTQDKSLENRINQEQKDALVLGCSDLKQLLKAL